MYLKVNPALLIIQKVLRNRKLWTLHNTDLKCFLRHCYNIFFCFQVSVRNSDRLSEISTTFKQKEKVSSLSELRSILNQLWIDDGILRCFNRRNEFQLIDSAEYFLDKVCIHNIIKIAPFKCSKRNWLTSKYI